MATKYLRLRAVAALIACGSLLPVACSGDDDTSGNPTPSSGGTGAKGGSTGKGGSSGKGGTSGNAGEDTGTGGTGNSSSGGKGGKGGTGTGGTGTGGTGTGGTGTGGTGTGGTGTGGTGTGGTSDAGTSNAGTGNGGEGNQPNPGGCLESDLTQEGCYADCDPKQTDDSLEFLNHCADGSHTLGGVGADCTPWTGPLSALGDGCTQAGGDCVLPALP